MTFNQQCLLYNLGLGMENQGNIRRRTDLSFGLSSWLYVLVLNGHKSYHLYEFEEYYNEHSIITPYMPAYSSHLFYLLNVGWFSPIKKAYGQEIQDMMRTHIIHITKDDLFPTVCSPEYPKLNHMSKIPPANCQRKYQNTGTIYELYGVSSGRNFLLSRNGTESSTVNTVYRRNRCIEFLRYLWSLHTICSYESSAQTPKQLKGLSPKPIRDSLLSLSANQRALQ